MVLMPVLYVLSIFICVCSYACLDMLGVCVVCGTIFSNNECGEVIYSPDDCVVCLFHLLIVIMFGSLCCCACAVFPIM